MLACSLKLNAAVMFKYSSLIVVALYSQSYVFEVIDEINHKFHKVKKLEIWGDLTLGTAPNLYFFDPWYSIPEGAWKLTKEYKGGYDRQSVQSAAGKLSCNKTALEEHCNKTDILWNR